eukprot:327783_1
MRTNNNIIICKSMLTDSFLLYLIKEEPKADNVKPYEYEYLENNKKFKLTKHIAIELYLGLQRLINRHKIKKWRKYANNIKKRDRHNGYRPLIAKLIYQLIINICDISNQNINNINDEFINKMYDDIGNIHYKSSIQNTKTRMSYLSENYNLGQSNTDFNTMETQNNFKHYKQISQRNGLSNNENVFKNFHFSLDIQLLLQQKRETCPYCGKNSHLYCPFCKIPFALTFNKKYIQFPHLKLPINIDIIRHPKEMVNVCSSVHGCVIAPNNVKMYEFPNIPIYDNNNDNNNDGIYLLYPSEKSVFLDEIDISEKSKIKKIIVIESRWRGNKQIYEHKQLINLPHCKIRNRQTLYWRYQEKSKEYLATIEAMYYAIVDCCGKYNGQFDDLLMLFAHDHQKIRNVKQSKNTTKSFWNV